MVQRYVVDASTVLSYILPDEATPAEVLNLAQEYGKGNIQILAPELLKLEVANALRSAVLRKRTTAKKAVEIFKEYTRLEIKYKPIEEINTLQIALKHNLTTYDAAYLALAKAEKAAFITLDIHLRKVFENIN